LRVRCFYHSATLAQILVPKERKRKITKRGAGMDTRKGEAWSSSFCGAGSVVLVWRKTRSRIAKGDQMSGRKRRKKERREHNLMYWRIKKRGSKREQEREKEFSSRCAHLRSTGSVAMWCKDDRAD
jgi:hypothetical protein